MANPDDPPHIEEGTIDFETGKQAQRSPGGRMACFDRRVVRNALWYDRGMKTAISLPDVLFLSADELAKRQGVSRSELYATAVSEYLAKHRDEDVTAKLNEVFADESSGLDPALRAAQARSVSSNKW